jgi:hypothetical protein
MVGKTSFDSFRDQARLADASLTFDEQQDRLTGSRFGDRGFECLKLLLAANQSTGVHPGHQQSCAFPQV